MSAPMLPFQTKIPELHLVGTAQMLTSKGLDLFLFIVQLLSHDIACFQTLIY